jgi:hypothetical protein
MTLTTRELATVVAALRHWQRSLQKAGLSPITEHFAEVTPLGVAEIDQLCERLNIPSENPLAFGAENPLKIKRWLRAGEFDVDSDRTVQDIYERAGELLDKACSWDICGECVFEGEDGKFYVGSVEFHLGEAYPDHVRSILEENEAEG